MAESDLDAWIATSSGDELWFTEANGGLVTLKTRVRSTHGGLETVVTANTGTSYAIDLVNGNVHDLTLTGNATLTLTGSTAAKGCSITVIIRQDATGGRTVTWPGTVKWIGVTPTWLTTASKIAGIVTLLTVDNGTVWMGFWAGSEQ